MIEFIHFSGGPCPIVGNATAVLSLAYQCIVQALGRIFWLRHLLILHKLNRQFLLLNLNKYKS